MKWRAESPTVFFAPEQTVVGPADLAELKRRAAAAGGRARLCLHAGKEAPLHEMIIALPRGEYVRPHKHRKPETYHVLEGSAWFFEFDEKGRVSSRERLSARSRRDGVVYRQRPGRYHGLLVLTRWLIFRETKLGPLRPEQTAFASWAPEPADAAAARRFLGRLKKEARR